MCTVTGIRETEAAIEFVKQRFSRLLARKLNLMRVSAPLCVFDDTGINDDLNGVEKPVSFYLKGIPERRVSVVQSLAKWKRVRLMEMDIEPGAGIYTEMRALRPDEDLDPIHSVFVDQWDWELRITREQRTIPYLKSVVKLIYKALTETEEELYAYYSSFSPVLPSRIKFLYSDDLVAMYPGSSPKEREYEITKKWGAVFIIGIGNKLSDGLPHDGRAPDYDDWTTETDSGHFGLNGDLIIWNPVLESAFEISSMGIRVDRDALIRQLDICDCNHRKELLFHKMLLEGKLPLSIGGGIGQSRVCMFLLRKSHIGEVQPGLWPHSAIQTSRKIGTVLL
ncbi:MAG: aspartate--ammonia ligase [Bacteroidetes bacterium]|nr:aspartate--ammonia ligase [Bacteroidota bacterium]MBU1720856.1 aspartate--ammonia ligase [Bacteroidota bacterium]